MAAEEITKYAINSTLGTEDFKPLDKIITDGKSLISSDNLYYQIFIGKKTIRGDDYVKTFEIPKKIKFNFNGTIKLKYYLYSAYYPQNAILEIYKNNVLNSTLKGSSEQLLLETILSVSKKDEFYFVFKNTTSGGANDANLIDLFIYADVIDNSGITVEEI